MHIEHFGPGQADVYIPTMAVLALGAIAIALPIVLAPALRGARGTVVRAICGLLLIASVAAGIALAIPAQHTLAAQVPAVQRLIEARYGVHLPASCVGRLIDGDTLKRGAKDGCSVPEGASSMRLSGKGHHRYDLVVTESAAAATKQLPVVGG